MAVSLQIQVNTKLFLRDPQETELGRKIINQSIHLIDEVGIERLTFRKLAERIGSTEASIYRYFANKHKLLIYLIAWYWSWVEFQLDVQTQNIQEPEQRLRIAIKVLSESSQFDPAFSYVDEAALHRIVIHESNKAYLTKDVDADNQEGFFQAYKSLTRKLANFIYAVNPAFPYCRSLASTLIESAHLQMFFAEHLPGLTDLRVGADHDKPQIIDYLEGLAFTFCKQYGNSSTVFSLGQSQGE
jgi:AcrR family transcriptional regulator